MKILMVNKFLYPNGGSETYIFKLSDQLKRLGHEVQFFGMEHERNIVGNEWSAYTSNMDFHTGKLQKILYPFKIIYSFEARKKIREVLIHFKPDVVHLNNFNFQITPSIIHEIKSFDRQNNKNTRIVFTAHDYQMVCPNHMMNSPNTKRNCEACIDGAYSNCATGRCIHNSLVKSVVGAAEAYVHQALRSYKYIDAVICPSRFLEEKIRHNKDLAGKTIAMHNFIDEVEWKDVKKENYVLYFGRFSHEKGIKTLIEACKGLPNIQFIFAGSGPLEGEISDVGNIKNVGFQSGEALELLIRKARFSVYPSEWYENCPFSVMESQMYGTPVLGANIGGIPELIHVSRTGELFESGNLSDLKKKIEQMWHNKENLIYLSEQCRSLDFYNISQYTEKIVTYYQ